MATIPYTNSGRPRRRSLWLAAIAGVVALLGADLSPVQALPDSSVSAALPPAYEVRENVPTPFTLGPGQLISVEASCSSSALSLLGGGASLSVEPSGGPGLSLTSNGPGSDNTSWRGEWTNLGTAPITFGPRVTAVCGASGLANLTTTTVTAALPPNSSNGGTVPCPPDRPRAIGGGAQNFLATVGQRTLPQNTLQGQAWRALWVNYGSSTVQSEYGLDVICIRPADFANTTIQSPRIQQITRTIAPGDSAIDTQTCSGSPLGGGVNIYSATPNNPAPKVSVIESGPIPSSPGQTTWRTRLHNFGDTQLIVQFFVSVSCVS
jgi:hypothetical protein